MRGRWHLLVKLRFQGLDDFLPVLVCCKTSSRSAADAVLAVKLYVERIKGMASRTDRDADTVCVLGYVLNTWQCFVFAFVEFETDLRQVIELWNGTAFNLGRDSSFQDAVEQCIDV